MILATLRGMVMQDFIKESNYEGEKTETRVIYLFQQGAESKELVEIKDIPEEIKTEVGKESSIPVLIRYWRNQKGQSGISVKYHK